MKYIFFVSNDANWKTIFAEITLNRSGDASSKSSIGNFHHGYETRQSSLLYVIVMFFGLDPAENTIVVYFELRN